MTRASDIIQRLDRVSTTLTAGDGDALWLAMVLEDWKAGMPFDLAAGLTDGWRRAWRQGERDAALRRLGRRFPGLAGRQTARAVMAALDRYETTAWPRDHRARRRPDGLAGDCYDVLSLDGAPGAEMLRRIFAG